ncbi:MAG: hypothetical protein O7I42_18770, partial [Alphaproteobacteria bacterium]|nr:hypothetical protein [Alphaproteobacteria bacterium]
AEHLTKASNYAKRWRDLQSERTLRQAIKTTVEPLKDLRAYVANEAKATLASVSERTEEIFDEIYAKTVFSFDEARSHDKKKSLFVTGRFDDGAIIDATWVANSS